MDGQKYPPFLDYSPCVPASRADLSAMLKAWRREMGFTQAQAARALRSGERTIRAWERGEVVPPVLLEPAMVTLARRAFRIRAVEIGWQRVRPELCARRQARGKARRARKAERERERAEREGRYF